MAMTQIWLAELNSRKLVRATEALRMPPIAPCHLNSRCLMTLSARESRIAMIGNIQVTKIQVTNQTSIQNTNQANRTTPPIGTVCSTQFSSLFRCSLATALMLALFANVTYGQVNADPVVARLEMKLTLKEKVLDVIQKGDLLTVLEERDASYVIQTFNGVKGAVKKDNVARLSEAVPIYDEMILKTPGEGRLYTLRASAQWALGKTDKALADYDQAIELGYAEAHAYASRGLFHAAMGNPGKAIEDYTRAMEEDADDEVPLINRAGAYMATGDYQAAIADYTEAIAKSDENPVLYSQRAVAHKLNNAPEKAIEDYTRSIELESKDVSAWMGRGFLQFQLGKHERAIEDFTQVIELAPQSAVAFNNRGYNYQILEDFEAAKADYKRAMELAPQYLLALQNRAWLLTVAEPRTLREPDVAIEIAIKVNEITQYKQISDLTLLAAAYASAGEFETAIGWQEKAVELAAEEQKPFAEKILELYRIEKPLDVKLLEGNTDQQ